MQDIYSVERAMATGRCGCHGTAPRAPREFSFSPGALSQWGSDAPRFLLTDALHWESARVIQTWSYRWACEIFHEFCKQVVGFEAAQVHNQEAVKRHFRLSCVAQSLLQQATCEGKKSERFAFAKDKQTVGHGFAVCSGRLITNCCIWSKGCLLRGDRVSKSWR